MTAVINSENKNTWIGLASTTSVAKLEKAVATACPKAAVKESIRYVTGQRLELKLGVSEEFREILTALKDLLAQKQKVHVDSENAILIAMKEMISRNSPLEKAKRASLRKQNNLKDAPEDRAKNAATNNSNNRTQESSAAQSAKNSNGQPHAHAAPTPTRQPIPAATKHMVTLRDGARCTHHDANGNRCAQTRWIDIYHIQEVRNGGANTLENLRTLCNAHHREIHRQAAAAPAADASNLS